MRWSLVPAWPHYEWANQLWWSQQWPTLYTGWHRYCNLQGGTILHNTGWLQCCILQGDSNVVHYKVTPILYNKVAYTRGSVFWTELNRYCSPLHLKRHSVYKVCNCCCVNCHHQQQESASVSKLQLSRYIFMHLCKTGRHKLKCGKCYLCNPWYD